ncbi:GNAT family N-acetyltransferase [Rhodanobacter sp. C03]|uniref:GNAT family N-acetyltransferase n=1 Tax=Rhodanobacter sp. C03 TaxID=1945858 RepID=UPI00143B09E6|nr:GNAT family N-acetyltransferase [Rhodanobacter sp. C03]
MAEFLIDVSTHNTASVKGVEKAGFLPVAQIAYLVIFNRFRYLLRRSGWDATSLSPDGQVTTRVIRDEAGWDAIRHDWDTLYAASPTASTPLDFAWLRSWWQVYKSALRAGELRIVTVWRAQQLIGAIPLYIHRGRGGLLGVRYLEFISTGEAEFEETCPDYLNILYLPSEEVICVDAVWQEIGRMDWDRLEFLDLPENTPLLRMQSLPHDAQRFSRGACLVADLTGGFEAYLDRLSSNSRQHVRRLMREGKRAGVQFEVINVDQLAGAFDDLVRLHQERWTADGKPGVFGAPRFVEFHHGLTSQWLPTGRVILARLSLASEPVVVLYGFVTGQTFDFYQSGMRLEVASPLRSPGNLAHLLLMKALIDNGVTAYDFLRGSASYKERLATRANPLTEIRISRPTVRMAVHICVRFAACIIRKGLHFVRRSTP